MVVVPFACQAVGSASSDIWHQRLGHPSRHIKIRGIDMSLGDENNKGCDVCLRAKQTRSQFYLSENKTEFPFQLVHCDLWGPYKMKSISGASYFLTIVDDFSRGVWLYLLREKTEAQRFLISFCNLVKNQFDRTVKIVRSDNGTEFLTKELQEFFSRSGIIHQTTCTDTPQQNGRVERKHRQILNIARALLFQASLPTRFWGECVSTAAHLINMTPTPLLGNKSPYEVLFDKQPDYSNLRVFGSLCYAHNKPRVKDKFKERSRKSVFIGYPYGKKGWRLYDLKTREVFVSRDVHFCEDTFPFAIEPIQSAAEQLTKTMFTDSEGPGEALQHGWPELGPGDNVGLQTRRAGESEREPTAVGSASQPNRRMVQFLESGQETSGGSSEQRRAVEPISTMSPTQGDSDLDFEGERREDGGLRRSNRDRHPPGYLKDYVVHTALYNPPSHTPALAESSGTSHPIERYLCYAGIANHHKGFLAAIDSDIEPQSYREAILDPRWNAAMAEEIRALESNKTWTIEKLPSGKRPIGCRWVFKVKRQADGSVERYKARLVAKGFTQVEGVDFHETFAPVAKLVTVRCLLSVAVAKGWELHQMDVNNAFLHGDLNEEVYMQLPPGFSSSKSGYVCRLRKSIYGLRQASRNWYAKLADALQRYGFKQSGADYSLFTCTRGTAFLGVLVYVDDLIIVGNASDWCASFKAYLKECFHIKDLGSLRYFLGIEVTRKNSGLFLSQRKYALDILTECGMLGSRPSQFPMEQHHRLSTSTSVTLTDPAQYRRLVGRLIYLTITRPELSYSLHVLAQFMHEPRQDHWDAAMRVLRYLKQSPGQGIFLRPNSLELQAYCDSDWAGCPLTRRSVTGYFITLGGCPISWKTKKQTTVSRSSAEAEYRAMASTVSEIIWLRSLLNSLGITYSRPTRLFCDNQAALHIAANPVFHERTKHIEIDCHFIREHIQSGAITTSHVPTRLQLADIFTKALGRDRFRFLLDKLGVRDLHAPT